MSKDFNFVALDELRAELSNEIGRIGGQYDIAAKYDAVHAIRDPSDENLRRAERMVLKSDCYNEVSREAREAVNRVWVKVAALIKEHNQP